MAQPDPVEQARAWLRSHTGPGPGGDQHDGTDSLARPVPDGAPDDDVRTDPIGPAGISAAGSGDPENLDGAEDDPATRARTTALRKLTASARTRHELDQALRRKNVPDAVAAEVLDRFEEVGLVDDRAFAHSWVDSRQGRRHLSRSALRRELRAKGVDREHIDAALAAVGIGEELAVARALVAKRLAATAGLDPMVRRRRLAGALARRGFGPGIVATVLSEMLEGSALDPDA